MNLYQQITNAPVWLLGKVVNEPNTQSMRVSNSGILAGSMYAEGRRHKDFVSQAGTMRRNGSSPEFIAQILLTTNAALPNPLPEDEVNAIAYSMNRYEPSYIEALTHKSLAEFLCKDQEDQCLYCVGSGFYTYQNHVWERDEEELQVFEKAIELTDKIMAQVDQMRTEMDDASYKKLKAVVLSSQKTPFITNALKQFKSKKSVRFKYDQFNARKDLINFRNGVLNTQSFELETHRPDHYFTWMVDVDYQPEATCPAFDKFLDDILPPESQRLLLQLIACCFSANGREQKFAFLVGERQNGKSTFVSIMSDIFGELCANVEPSSFMVKGQGQIPNDLARLAGKRLVFTSETKLGNIMDAPLLKRMTGGDKVTARFMRAEFFEFTPEFVPLIVTNYLPVIDGSDTALKRRMIVVPFDRIIPDADVDRDLTTKLRAEKSGIINRILDALRDYNENGLVIPEEVQRRTEEYVDSSNLMKRFFEENFQVAEGQNLGARTVYSVYVTWSESYKIRPMSEPQFKIAFERATGLTQIPRSRGNFWPNIAQSLAASDVGVGQVLRKI